MTRILLMRHCEEPNVKDNAEMGMTDQGAVRTINMPILINQLKTDDEKMIIVYTAGHNSRSYLTAQCLQHTIVSFKSSNDINKLVDTIKKDRADLAIVIWEHNYFPLIVFALTERLIDFKAELKTIKKAKQLKPLREYTVSHIHPEIVYCHDDFIKDNLAHRNDIIKRKHDFAYSIIFDFVVGENTVISYPGLVVKSRNNNRFLIQWYV